MGVGVVSSGFNGVNWRAIGWVILGWVLTIPVSLSRFAVRLLS